MRVNYILMLRGNIQSASKYNLLQTFPRLESDKASYGHLTVSFQGVSVIVCQHWILFSSSFRVQHYPPER